MDEMEFVVWDYMIAAADAEKKVHAVIAITVGFLSAAAALPAVAVYSSKEVVVVLEPPHSHLFYFYTIDSVGNDPRIRNPHLIHLMILRNGGRRYGCRDHRRNSSFLQSRMYSVPCVCVSQMRYNNRYSCSIWLFCNISSGSINLQFALSNLGLANANAGVMVSIERECASCRSIRTTSTTLLS